MTFLGGGGGISGAGDFLARLGLDGLDQQSFTDAIGQLSPQDLQTLAQQLSDAAAQQPTPGGKGGPAGKGGQLFSALGLDGPTQVALKNGVLDMPPQDLQALADQFAALAGSAPPLDVTSKGSVAGKGGALPPGAAGALCAQLAGGTGSVGAGAGSTAGGRRWGLLAGIGGGVVTIIVAGTLIMGGGGSSSPPSVGGTGPGGSTALSAPPPVLPPASETSWNGTWHVESACSAVSCGGVVTTGTFTLVESGGHLGGSIVAAGQASSHPFSGTASGSSANLSYPDPLSTVSFDLVLATDGQSFSGTARVTETSTGRSGLASTVTGTRIGGGLTISVAAATPLGHFRVGGTTPVAVEITAVGGDVHDISFAPGLVVSKGLVVRSTPKSLQAFSLSRGATRTFIFAVRGVAAGSATMSVDVSGTNELDAEVTGTASVAVTIAS